MGSLAHSSPASLRYSASPPLAEHIRVGIRRVEERVVVSSHLPLEEPPRQSLRVRPSLQAGRVVDVFESLEDAVDGTVRVVIHGLLLDLGEAVLAQLYRLGCEALFQQIG